MPAVVPSQILMYIDTTLSDLVNATPSGSVPLEPSMCGALNALLRLIEQLPNHLLPSDPNLYAAFIQNQESIRFVIKQAENHNFRAYGPLRLTQDGPDKRNQVQVIRAALFGCPDEVPPHRSNKLPFTEKSVARLDDLNRLDHLNLLAAYDVLLDLQEELNIAPPGAPVSIRLRPLVCRFRAIGERDDYAERRLKLLRYLEERGIISEFLFHADPRNRDSRFTVSANRETINAAVELVTAEHQRRPRSAVSASTKSSGNKVIFIGHGRSGVWKDLKEFLEDRLKLTCIEFNSEPAAGVSTKERLEEMLNQSGFAFLVMTAEDERLDGTRHARENVIHEVGLFQGRLGFERAIILLEEGCAQFSNIHGLTHIPFSNGEIRAVLEEIRRVLEREGLVQKS